MANTTLLRLQEAALTRFAIQGFDAASLSEIASDVGIKKPSVYTHFRNKDELYLSLIPLLITAELDYAASMLQGGDQIKQQLHGYLAGIQERFDASYRVQFWIRALTAPPNHLLDVVLEPMHVFMDDLEDIIRRAVENSSLVPNRHRLTADVLAKMYMSMIDSLQTEFLYGGPEKYRRRLHAIWMVFEAAVEPT
ncbi:TetR/AcrR family transcriptional regulator [Massilia sp. BSC265]|uniref:TetR/AcrR family transcriptional regulator n=1 Tax=Massilia sp. BSC265 TaxID=1549812 RepID=UPI0004E97E8B|nr:TetR/AcrR family transcriptional regulator [Massilia sp. BSC265]KFI08894.1 TetR family transcriptional regulator [Massilia sp. BSC265]